MAFFIIQAFKRPLPRFSHIVIKDPYYLVAIETSAIGFFQFLENIRDVDVCNFELGRVLRPITREFVSDLLAEEGCRVFPSGDLVLGFEIRIGERPLGRCCYLSFDGFSMYLFCFGFFIDFLYDNFGWG
jgi:hypothetical protein